jgi:hypothetical protein
VRRPKGLRELTSRSKRLPSGRDRDCDFPFSTATTFLRIDTAAVKAAALRRSTAKRLGLDGEDEHPRMDLEKMRRAFSSAFSPHWKGGFRAGSQGQGPQLHGTISLQSRAVMNCVKCFAFVVATMTSLGAGPNERA